MTSDSSGLQSLAVIDAYHQFHFELLRAVDSRYALGRVFCLGAEPEKYYGDPLVLETFKADWHDRLEVQSFSNLIFQDKINLLVSEPWVIDQIAIDHFAQYKHVFYTLCDRSAVLGMSSLQKDQIFYLLLNYFLNLHQRYHFDLCITFDTPHSFFSNLFYQVLIYCQVKVLRLEYHYVPGFSILLDQNPLPPIPVEYLAGFERTDIFGKLSDSLKLAFSSNNEYFANYAIKEAKAVRGSGFLSNASILLRGLAKTIANVGLGILAPVLQREILHFTSLHSLRNRMWYRWRINRPMWKLISYHIEYNKLSEQVSLDRDFILFAMHMQPEKTSHPLGGDFANQLLPIKMLSESAPAGWLVYVKEHPNQFNVRKVANALYRSKDFYEAIALLPNVRLVDLSISSQRLLKQAKMVATLTGTIGWEALQLGIPVLAFGETYYSNCRSVRSPRSVSECKRDISDLDQLSVSDIETEVWRQLKFCEDDGILVASGNFEPKIETAPFSRAEQISALSDLFVKRIEAYF